MPPEAKAAAGDGKKYTATVTGGDRALNEKVARALLARFEKM